MAEPDIVNRLFDEIESHRAAPVGRAGPGQSSADPLDATWNHTAAKQAVDPLDAMWADAPARRAGINFVVAAGSDPDAAGRANVISRDTGLPADTVDRNFAAVQARQQAERNSAVVAKNPQLATWASNPRNAAVATDDVGVLDRLGNWLGEATNYLGASAMSGLHSAAAAGAKIVDEVNPFTTSDADLAVLYKNDPAGLARAMK